MMFAVLPFIAIFLPQRALSYPIHLQSIVEWHGVISRSLPTVWAVFLHHPLAPPLTASLS